LGEGSGSPRDLVGDPSRSTSSSGTRNAIDRMPAPPVDPPLLKELPAAAKGRDVAVARVDGKPVFAADAYRLLFLSVPDDVEGSVRQLVVDRVAAAEAARLRAAVPPDVVAREYDRMIAAQEKKISEGTRGREDLAAYVKRRYRLEKPAYLAFVKASLERSLLLERIVLYELGGHPRVQLRMVRVKDKALADDLHHKLEQGADFAALARQNSEDASARDGGVYPPLPSDLGSPLFERTDALKSGELSAVEELSTPDGPRYRIVQVLARLPAESGDYAQRAAAIEQTLDGRALSPLELEAWTHLMEERHAVEFLGMGSDDDGA
jgi:hypothetical protein